MPYPRRLINEGEEVAFDLRPHWWFFSKQILTGVPLFILVVLILQLSDTPEKVAFWVWAVVALVWAGWLLIQYLNWQFTYFVVTSDRVIFRTGVLSKRGVEIPLERINNINFHQRIWERVIGAGDLDIESAGQDGRSAFSDVRHPDGVQQEIYRQMEANARKRASWVNAPAPAPAATPPPPAASASGIPEQLQQLAELRDKGVITAAEFETKKAQLLERM